MLLCNSPGNPEYFASDKRWHAIQNHTLGWSYAGILGSKQKKVRVMTGLCAKKVFLNKTKPKDHSFSFSSGQWGHTEPGHQLNPDLHIMYWIPAPANFRSENFPEELCSNTAKVTTEETMNPKHPGKWGVVRCHLYLCKKLSEAGSSRGMEPGQ